MTKFIEWARMKIMSSKEKSNINTATTFSEQRKETNKPIGVGQKNENNSK